MKRERQEQDLKDEIAFHLNAEVERRVEAAQSRADALASAKRDFGNVTLVEEVTRGTWGWSMQDYKLGLRMLAKYPGLSFAGGLALAIAIGIGAAWYDVSRDLHPSVTAASRRRAHRRDRDAQRARPARASAEFSTTSSSGAAMFALDRRARRLPDARSEPDAWRCARRSR